MNLTDAAYDIGKSRGQADALNRQPRHRDVFTLSRPQLTRIIRKAQPRASTWACWRIRRRHAAALMAHHYRGYCDGWVEHAHGQVGRLSA